MDGSIQPIVTCAYMLTLLKSMVKGIRKPNVNDKFKPYHYYHILKIFMPKHNSDQKNNNRHICNFLFASKYSILKRNYARYSTSAPCGLPQLPPAWQILGLGCGPTTL